MNAFPLSKAGSAAITVATTWIVLLVGIGALRWAYPQHFPVGGAQTVKWSLLLVLSCVESAINVLIPFSKNDATHLFEKTAQGAEPKTRSVANLREIGMS